MKIIAESASNHSGQLEYLVKMADASKNSGADYFTIQILNPASFCSEDYERYDVVAEIAFSFDQWTKLLTHCNKIGLEVIPCPLDIDSLNFCIEKGFKLIKVHATDIVNVPFLKEIMKNDLKVILETQCATYQDIKLALSVIGSQIDAIIHGYSNYPTEIEDQRLNALDYIRKEFDCDVGFADHTLDTSEIPLMTLAKGAKYLEKHITLSRNDRHYDWQVSLYPEEFASMVSNIRHYEKALGAELKHPDPKESGFRGVLYKKVIGGNLKKELKRADHGMDYLTELINSFSKDRLGVGIIARLKSQRLKQKVLLPLLNGSLIQNLYQRIGTSEKISEIAVITSYLPEDEPLVKHCEENNLKVFLGHPVSVIDRMLSFILENRLGMICRVTGDNPFSDPLILDHMADLMIKEDLDYIKVNNVPIGVGIELYSSSYLWRMYLKMENPLSSEYLSWFGLKDESSKKGSIDIQHENKDLNFYNLSVDYQADYDRCLKVLATIGKKDFDQILLKDVLNAMESIEPSDRNMIIKLPGDQHCTFEEFNKLIDNADYKVRRTLNI